MIIDRYNQHRLGVPIGGYVPNIVNFDLQKYEIVPDKDNLFFYGRTPQEFLSRIRSIKLNFQDRIINIPRCIYFDNIVEYRIYDEVYKNINVKKKMCESCLFLDGCSGINYVFFKIYGGDILQPITRLSDNEVIKNKFILYEPFYEYLDWYGNPPKINHYMRIYRFISALPKNSRILEVGCFIGLFVDFLIKDGFTNITGCDRDARFVEIGVEKGGLPLRKADIYNEQLSDIGGKYDVIVMFGVLHNDYSIDEYHTTILDYSLRILSNIYNALAIGGHCLFTTHVFSLSIDVLIDIGFTVIESYQEEEHNSVFTYIVKKGS